MKKIMKIFFAVMFLFMTAWSALAVRYADRGIPIVEK